MKKSNFRKIYTRVVQTVSTTGYILFMGFILSVVLSFAFSIGMKEEPTIMGLKPIYILSGSMEDGIKTNSVIISKRLGTKGLSSLKVGDVVTFEVEDYGFPSGVRVTHRIVDIKDDTFLSKGDANKTNDFFNEELDGYLPLDVIKYKMVMTNNWVANVVYVVFNQPIALAMYVSGALLVLFLINLANSHLYKKEYEFDF